MKIYIRNITLILACMFSFLVSNAYAGTQGGSYFEYLTKRVDYHCYAMETEANPVGEWAHLSWCTVKTPNHNIPRVTSQMTLDMTGITCATGNPYTFSITDTEVLGPNSTATITTEIWHSDKFSHNDTLKEAILVSWYLIAGLPMAPITYDVSPTQSGSSVCPP